LDNYCEKCSERNTAEEAKNNIKKKKNANKCKEKIKL
jgi:hypothetical protein